jgi:hypothetical protein
LAQAKPLLDQETPNRPPFVLPLNNLLWELNITKKITYQSRDRKVRLGHRLHYTTLTGLLTYRQQVNHLAQTPLGVHVVLRYLLLMAIPVGSWFGGALVERFIDLVIG